MLLNSKQRKNLTAHCYQLAHDWLGFYRSNPNPEYLESANKYRGFAREFRKGNDPGFRAVHYARNGKEILPVELEKEELVSISRPHIEQLIQGIESLMIHFRTNTEQTDIRCEFCNWEQKGYPTQVHANNCRGLYFLSILKGKPLYPFLDNSKENI